MNNLTEFNEFFGPNVLYKAGPLDNSIEEDNGNEDKLKKKLNIELFLSIISHINYLKFKLIKNCETLIIEIVELIGKFNEIECYDYNYDYEIRKYNCKSFNELIEFIKIEDNNDNNDIDIFIDNISIINTFNNSTMNKIFESKLELLLLKSSLNDFLINYQLKKFKEPEQQSIEKINFLYDILIKSVNNSNNNIMSFINDKLNELNNKFEKINTNINKSLKIIENDIIESFTKFDNYSNRKIELFNISEDLKGLYNLYLTSYQINNYINNLNSINNDRTIYDYKSILIKQRNKLSFLNKFLIKSIESIKSTNEQLTNNSKLYNIIKYNDSNNNNNIIHSLIKNEFHIESDPIKLLFNKFDKSNKGFLTKNEFKMAFLKAYPMSKDELIENEIDTIFETNYELMKMKKSRRGIELPQFHAIIKLGMQNNTFIPISPEKISISIDINNIIENINEIDNNSLIDYKINEKLINQFKNEFNINSLISSIENNEITENTDCKDISVLQLVNDIERIDLDKLV